MLFYICSQHFVHSDFSGVIVTGLMNHTGAIFQNICLSVPINSEISEDKGPI